MASFEEYSSKKSKEDTILMLPKHPIKRFQPALEKFINIALPTDLKRLHRHQINMEKFYQEGSWHELNAEQINAARTVQQLKVNIRELENIRRQVQPSDIPVFDDRVAAIKDEALQGVRAFREVQRLYSERPRRTKNVQGLQTQTSQQLPSLETNYEQQQQQQQLLLEEETSASWDALQESLEDLNVLIHDFSAIVHEQQLTLDSITDNIENAHVNVQQGTTELGKARKLQAAILPVIGALIGGAAGGPIGLVFGLKIGAAAALGGGIAGFAGGEMLKKKGEKNVDTELQNLSSNKETRIVKKHL